MERRKKRRNNLFFTHDRSKGHLWRTLWSNIPGLRVEVVGNKVKWRISKRVFQKNKARQILEKRTLLTP